MVRTVLVAHPSPDLYGSDRVLLDSVSGLVAAGWRVVATVPDDGPLVPELEARGAEVVVCPAPVLRKAALRPVGLVRLAATTMVGTVAGLRLIRTVAPDAVFVNTVTVPWWFVLGALARRPMIAHVHEAEENAGRLQRWAMVAPLRLAGAVAANSHFSRRVLASHDPRVAARAVVVPNPVPAPAAVTEAPERPVGRVGYLGRLAPRKGVDVAVRALALLRAEGHDLTLDLVGAVFPGYEWYEAELRDLVAELGLADAVTFHGFLSDAVALIPDVDVLLVPSRLPEPFGNVAVEGALAARPVVASDIGGLPEAVAGLGSAVTVTPDDPRALADGVARVLADWPRARAAALADSVTVRERHDPVRYGARIAALVAEVAGEGPA